MLPATVVLSNVVEAREALRAALATGEPVAIDTAELTEIDFAGLQLLCAAHRSAAQQGRSLAVAGGTRGAVIDRAVLALGFGRGGGCPDGCPCQEAPRA